MMRVVEFVMKLSFEMCLNATYTSDVSFVEKKIENACLFVCAISTLSFCGVIHNSGDEQTKLWHE